MKLKYINYRIKKLTAKKCKIVSKIEKLIIKRYNVQTEIDLENMRKRNEKK